MTVKRIDILGGGQQIVIDELAKRLDNGWTIIAHSAFTFQDGNTMDRFWLQSPKSPKGETHPVATDVQINSETAQQEAELRRLLKIVDSGDYVVLDTETNGLDDDAEIVDIAILHADGRVLLNTLVCPENVKRDVGTRWHGIKTGAILSAESWLHVSHDFLAAVADKPIVIYNKSFDMRLLRQSHIASGLFAETIDAIGSQAVCAMEAFAVIYGEYHQSKPGYKWKSLDVAREYYSLPPIKSHRALNDCQTTLAVIKALADTFDDA